MGGVSLWKGRVVWTIQPAGAAACAKRMVTRQGVQGEKWREEGKIWRDRSTNEMRNYEGREEAQQMGATPS
eukprot:754568-Hanusia_phi.AAC.3